MKAAKQSQQSAGYLDKHCETGEVQTHPSPQHERQCIVREATWRSRLFPKRAENLPGFQDCRGSCGEDSKPRTSALPSGHGREGFGMSSRRCHVWIFVVVYQDRTPVLLLGVAGIGRGRGSLTCSNHLGTPLCQSLAQ